jgi:mono/diheme cytochrome c family protein
MNSYRVALIATVALSCSACGSARRGEPYAAELVPSTEALKQGEQVFYRYCHQCHTGGEASLAPAINNKPLPAWLMRLQVRRGLGAMPAFDEKEIDERELDSLVAYLIALRRHRGDTADAPSPPQG